MGNRSKRAGDRWEREARDLLGAEKQPSSGAFGTQHNDASLTGDLIRYYPWWFKKIHIECKYGYGTSKSMRIQRDWFVKVREEAELCNRYPAVAIKFRDVTGGDIESAKVICFNIDTWIQMMEEISLLYSDHLALQEKLFKIEHGEDLND